MKEEEITHRVEECLECQGTGQIDARNCSSCDTTGKIIVHSHEHRHGDTIHDHPHHHHHPHQPGDDTSHEHSH